MVQSKLPQEKAKETACKGAVWQMEKRKIYEELQDHRRV